MEKRALLESQRSAPLGGMAVIINNFIDLYITSSASNGLIHDDRYYIVIIDGARK